MTFLARNFQKAMQQAILLLTCLVLASCGSSDEDTTVYTINADVSNINVKRQVAKDFTHTTRVNVNLSGGEFFLAIPPESDPTFNNRIDIAVVSKSETAAELDITLKAEDGLYLNEDQYSTILRLYAGSPEGNHAFHDINVELEIWNFVTDKELIETRQRLSTSFNVTDTVTVDYQGTNFTAELSPINDDSVTIGDKDILIADLIDLSWVSNSELSSTVSVNIKALETTFVDTAFNDLPIYIRLSTGQEGTGDYAYIDFPVTLSTYGINFSSEEIEIAQTLNSSSEKSGSFTIQPLNSTWQFSSNVDWLNLSIEETNSDPIIDEPTTGEPTNEFSALTTLTVTPDMALINTSGMQQGTITLTETLSGTTETLKVNLAVDDLRLFTNFPAINFSATPSQENTQQTVTVLTNASELPNWQASTTADWLSLTQSNQGKESQTGTLTISADSSKVADGLTSAEITISAIDNPQITSGTVTVTINKSGADNNDIDITTSAINSSISESKLDHTRPWFYVIVGNSLRIYNLIDGSLINTITTENNAEILENIVLTPDSQTLLLSSIVDSNLAVYQLSLSEAETATKFTPMTLDNNSISSQPVNSANIDGLPVIITEQVNFADLSLQLFAGTGGIASNQIFQLNDKSAIHAYSNNHDSAFEFKPPVNAYAEKQLSLIEASAQHTNLQGKNTLLELIPNASSTKLYALNNSFTASNEWYSVENDTITGQGRLFTPTDNSVSVSPLAVATDKKDNAYFIRFENNEGYVLRLYNEVGTELAKQVFLADITGVTFAHALICPEYNRIIIYIESTDFTGFKLLSIN